MVRHNRDVAFAGGTNTSTDINPIKHLFLPPPVPSLQTSAQSSIATAQFSKYKSTLRQQLVGRTPLLNSMLVALERHASDIQNDLIVMLKSGDSARYVATDLVGFIA